jgi:sugar phosphate isomerase/epimerase
MPLSRRSFVSTSAALTAGAALAAAPTALRAIEPIARNGQPKFKFSLAAYSYRDLLGGMTPKLTMNDFVSDCAKFNLDGTELTSYYFPKNVTHDYLRSLAQQCFRLGLDVSGTAVGNDFGHPPGEKRLKEIAATKQWIDFAAVLGAPVIRIFAGHEQAGSTPAQAHSLMVAGIEECCEYAGKHGIYLALENHGGPTATAEGLLSFVRDVNSPWFGVNLDTGNFASADVYGDLAKVAPYAVNVQIKVVVSNDKKEKSPADFKKLAALLRQAHYRGYIVLEFEEKGDPREECPKHLDKLREAFA